jgi:hypothetical protein
MPDSADDGLPLPVFRNKQQQHLNLPLPTISLFATNCVSVSHVFLYVCACSVATGILFQSLCLCSPMLSRVFAAFTTVRFVSFIHSSV